MAAYQIFNLAFIALLWLKGSSRSMKIFLAIVALLDIGAFIAAQSRGALVGLGAGILTFGIAYALTSASKKTRKLVLGGVAALFLCYGAIFVFRQVPFIQNSPLNRLTEFNSGGSRLIAWNIAWKGFLERPITGWGFDAFHILFNAKYNPDSLHYGYYETWFDRSHNTVMDVLSMTGILGLITFVGLFGTLFYTIIRSYKKGWIDAKIMSVLLGLPVAYFIQNLFVFDHPAAFSMSYLLFALVVAISSPRFMGNADGAAHQPSVLRAGSMVGFIVLQCVMIGIVWQYSWLPAKASVLSIDSNNAFQSGQNDLAVDLAEQAAATPTPYLDEQTFLQSRNLISLASSGKLSDFPRWREWHDLIVKINEEHLADHPKNTNPHFVYARFAEVMGSAVPGDLAIAEREYKVSMALSPKRQQLYYSYARFLISQGRKDEALVIIKKVLSFDEQQGESHWLLGLHYFYDRNLKKEGAEEMTLSQTVQYPYDLQSIQEALALCQAYEVTGNKKGLQAVVLELPKITQGPLEYYLQIAASMEREGLIAERNYILSALSRASAELNQALAPVLNGSATSIDAALRQTQGVQPTVLSSSSPSQTTSGSRGPRK